MGIYKLSGLLLTILTWLVVIVALPDAGWSTVVLVWGASLASLTLQQVSLAHRKRQELIIAGAVINLVALSVLVMITPGSGYAIALMWLWVILYALLISSYWFFAITYLFTAFVMVTTLDLARFSSALIWQIILFVLVGMSLAHAIWLEVQNHITVSKALVRYRQELKHLRQTDKDKTEILSLVAHQLKTPLSLIRWSNESVLHNSHLTVKEHERLEESISTTHIMYRTIEDLSHIFKLISKTGHQYLKYEKVDVLGVINELLDEYKTVADQHDMKIKLVKPPRPATVRADHIFLKHAIANLVDNAIKYSPAGSTVTITLERQRSEVTIAVADHGIGIDPASMKHLFERFFRSDKAREVNEHGTGLGLYLVRTIVDRMGGNVDVQSEEGKGSTFTITFAYYN